MLVLIILAVFGTGVCLGGWLRDRQAKQDWRRWEAELTPRDIVRGSDGLPHFRRSL